MQTISNTQPCVLSQFYDWLTCRNVRVIDSWLLLSLPAGGGSAALWWPRPVLRGLCVMGRLVSGYSLLPLPSPPTLSRIMDHKTARTRARRAGDGSLECPLIIVMRSRQQWMNLHWCAYIGRIMADTTVADTIRYDTPSIGTDTIPIR